MTGTMDNQRRLSGVEAVAIGASAGGIAALSEILPTLAAPFPVPVFIVVHLLPEKPSQIASVFQSKCRVAVKEAEDKEAIVPGTVYIAPPDYHLLVEFGGTLSLSTDEPVHFSRPSIDVLFESASDAYGAGLLAMVLTGANEDGAHGLQQVCAAGGIAVVQSPESAEAPAMPAAALAACVAAQTMNLNRIAELLQQVAREVFDHAARAH